MEAYQMLPVGAYGQLINDHIAITPSQTITHQRIVQKIANQLYHKVEKKGLGEFYFLPVDVYLY